MPCKVAGPAPSTAGCPAMLCKTHTAWPTRLLAAPTVLGVADTSGIEWMHPKRAGRRLAQSGHKGQSKPRWMGRGQLCFILHHWDLIWARDGAPLMSMPRMVSRGLPGLTHR